MEYIINITSVVMILYSLTVALECVLWEISSYDHLFKPDIRQEMRTHLYFVLIGLVVIIV